MRIAVALVLVIAATTAWAQAPADYDALLRQAHEHTVAGRTAEADAALLQAIEVAPDETLRAAAIFTLGVARERREDVAGAMEAFGRALDLDGGGEWQVRALQRLAWHADRSRDGLTARAAWERLLALVDADAPEAAEALVGLARLDLQAGRLDEATARFEALLATEAHRAWHAEAHESLSALLLAQGEPERALEHAGAIEDEARRLRAELDVGSALLDAGDGEGALELGRSILRRTPGSMAAMRLAYAGAVQAQALDRLRSGLRAEADGDAPEAALTFLAEMARWEEDPAAAVGYLQRLAELRPQDAEVRVKLAQTALDAELLDEAEGALREALRLAPENRGAQITLAEVLVQRGRTDEAIAQLKSAVGYDPADEASVRSLDQALRRSALHYARVEAIGEARAATGDEALMAYELARAHVDLLQYERAATEFLRALKTETVPARAVAIELERLVADAIAGPEVLEAVREHIAATGAPPDGERLALARVLLAADERETALGLLEGVAGAGSAVADLGREARFRGDRVGASELLALALTMDLAEHERADVALTLAMLQRDGGAWREALQTLDATPALAGHPEALLMRARLLTDRARELEAAREAWDKLAACSEVRYREAAREGMADWLFASGRLDEAEAAYAELAEERPTDEVGFEPLWGELPPLPPGMLPPGIGIAAPPVEEAAAADPARAALRLAEIALRRRDLEAAEARFRFVVEDDPLGVHANDALERLAFMRENLDGEGGSEARYLEAIGLMERGEAAMARDLLLEIAGTRDEPLADDALMALGEVRLMQDDARAAVETWLSLPERFAESMLAPGALLRAADVLRGELADEAGAADALRRITEGYPDSAAADQARSELELLGRRDP